MPQIGVIADDLTGATTCAALLARSGAQTVVFTNGRIEGCGKSNDLSAVILSTNSRTMTKHAAYQTVLSSTAALQKSGAKYFSKRIDTTLRGCIGAEIDAMMEVIGKDAVAVVVPAMPQSRRIMVGGYSIIDGVALAETNAAQDVLTPVRESYVPRLLQMQTDRKVGLITLEDVSAGHERILERFRSLREAGYGVIAVDAINLHHVDEIAKACTALGWDILAVDPGAFTRQLAFRRGLVGDERPRMPKNGETVKNKSVLVVAGSASEVTRRQIAAFCEEQRVIKIPVRRERLIGALREAALEIDDAAQIALDQLRSDICPKGIVFGTACFGERIDLDAEDTARGYARGGCANRINHGLGAIVRRVMKENADRIAGLYCTGGDTQTAVCDALEITCLEAVDYLTPQTDISHMTGRYAGMTLIGKGGLTGDDDIVNRIVERILLEAGGSDRAGKA